MSAPDASPVSAAPARPLRVAALTGTVACGLLIAQFFLPIFRLESRDLDRLADRVAAESEAQSRDLDLARDFAEVFRSVTLAKEVSPADLVHYARTAGPQRRNLEAAPDPARPGPDPFERVLRLVLLLALIPPIGAGLLLGYLIVHRFRRFTSPMLVLALCTSVVALALPVAHQYARHLLMPQVAPAIGMWMALAGGAVLLLTSVFGVRLRNWWRVYLIGAATLGSLGVLTYAWLTGAFA